MPPRFPNFIDPLSLLFPTPPRPTPRKFKKPRPTPPSTQLSGALQKARLIPHRTNTPTIEFQFNPTELKFDYSIQTEDQGRTSKGIRKISFAGPNPTTLSISNITFDTFEEGTSVEEKYLKPLRAALAFDEAVMIKKRFEPFQSPVTPYRRPPMYIFQWGKQRYLKCFVKKIDYKITLFLPDGTPVRAVANLSLEEVTKITLPKKKK